MFGKKGLKRSNKVDPKQNKTALELLEPFQEVVDEALDVDWGELEGQDFPFSTIGVDKNTASQAVALVISASRRGVVSLCAEVAELIKSKNRLEAVVEEQKEEINRLMDNQQLPRSPSPIPPVMIDFSMQTLQEIECQTTTLENCSTQTENLILPCAQIKILDESEAASNNIETTRLRGVEFECGRDYKLECTCPKMMTSSTQNPIMASVGVNTEDLGKLNSELGYFEHHRLDHQFKDLEVKHKNLINEARETVLKSNKFESELAEAKQEIVTLQKAIQDVQAKEYDRIKEEERLRMEETFSVDVHDTESYNESITTDGNTEFDVQAIVKRKTTNALFPYIQKGYNVSMQSSIFPGPILGCKCQMCTTFFRSSGLLGFACTPYVTDSSGKNPVLRDMRKLISLQNAKLQIHPNDKVLLHNHRTGVVRYVGHLDGTGIPSVVYAGLELESATGKHDGYLFGKRYFFTPQNHGLFLPLQDVVCVINKKASIASGRQRHLEENFEKCASRLEETEKKRRSKASGRRMKTKKRFPAIVSARTKSMPDDNKSFVDN